MADRHRKSSPTQSRSSRKRHGSRRDPHYEEIVPEPIPQPLPQQRRYEPDMRSKATEQDRAVYASSYSSSSSSIIVDISRTFPPNRWGIRTFFTAPSEHRRKLRRRRSSRLFKIGNSSTSSVNSDLAYGTGFIKRPKSRVRSRKGKEIDREKYTERYGERYDARYSDRDGRTSTATNRNEQRDSRNGLSQAATDAEILAVGAGLAKLAKEQNRLDLLATKSGRKPELVAVKETGHGHGHGHGLPPSRGLGPSKISHGSDTFDEEGWESASDDESDVSVDSRLAYDNNTKGGWRLFGRKKFKPLSRKNTIVDPRLFGPANSLHGVVTQPVGFGEVSSWTSVSDFGQRDVYPSTPAQGPSQTGSQQSLQKVFPDPTSDPELFTAGRGSRGSRGSVISGPEPPSYASNRPASIPLQQPQPVTPVSQSVYEPIYSTRSESGSILKKPSSSSRTPSLAQAAMVGVAGAAVGAAIALNRDDSKDRQREEDLARDRELRKRRDIKRAEAARESDRREAEEREAQRRDFERREFERRDAERREAERRDMERRDLQKRELERREIEKIENARRRDRRGSPDREEPKSKRRDREKDKKDDTTRGGGREKSRDETRDDREDRHEKQRKERRDERVDQSKERVDVRPVERRRAERPELVDRRTKSEAAVSSTSVDPFQYQVKDSAFPTPTVDSSAGHRTPTVVTVNREPDFSRMRSYPIKDSSSASDVRTEVRYSDKDESDRRPRARERDDPLREAEEIYEETKHFTAPIATAAIGAAIAAEHHRETRSDKRRDERRRDDYDNYDNYDYRPREKEADKDRDSEAERIQEEADRAYREIVMARKIASQVIRSRTPSPDRSVVDKYEEKEEEEVVRIVTPPGMEEHKKKGPYDAPNADFQLDHVIEPREMHIFRAPSLSYDRAASEPVFLKRDPGAERPRPLLNLVYPTPTPSPVPEKQKERSEPARSPKSKDREQPKINTSDVVIGPRGDVIASPTTSTVSKGVTWGENETKHYEVESPSEHKDEFVSAADLPSREVPQEVKSSGSKTKGWGAIAAGIMGAGIGAAAASSSDTSKSSKSKKDDRKSDASYEYRGVVVEPESPPRRKSPPRRERDQSPPSPGPKPAGPRSARVPGAFDDDLDFTATVAAGLQDTGFDPDIVINDPSFRRRDSPPGSNGPSIYHPPFAETVSDLGAIPPPVAGSVGSGFILGEVASTPKDWQSASPAAEEIETPTKPSKKDQKKRDKQRRQSGDVTPLEESSSVREVAEEPKDYFKPKLSRKEQKKLDKEAARKAALAEEEIIPSVAEQIVEEPESYSVVSKKFEKPKRSSSLPDEIADTAREARTVSVPVNAYDDLKNGDDDWTDTKRTKNKKRDSDNYDSSVRAVVPSEIASEISSTSSRKSKRDSERYESPPQSVPSYSGASDIGGTPRSKRGNERYESPPRSRDAVSDISRSSSTKDKSKRRSEQYEREPEEVSLPPSTASEVSRDGDYDDRRSRQSSNRDSGIFSSTDRDLSQSVVSADASRYDDSEPRRKNKSRSGRDDYDDSRSVASAPAGDDYDDSRKSKKKDKDKDKKAGIFSSLFGSKSEPGAREDNTKSAKDDGERRKSKRSKRHSVPDSSSIYDGIGADSVSDLSRSVSNGSHGKHHYEDDLDDGVRSDGEKRRKSRSRSASTTSTKKDSFLGNAGILGAGVGIAGAAAVATAAQQHRQSKAANTNTSETAEQTHSLSPERSMARDDILDPEIAERQFRPSIDPQYGDLLPLPPSDPASPNVEPIEELPALPESRPDTPDTERISREKGISAIRRNLQETPMKSPSQSAVPLIFKMGNRSTPSSPGLVRSSPGHSPATPNPESLGFPKSRQSRPTSWDKSTEYKPLWLPEVTRRGSTAQLHDSDDSYPELPPSEATSRSSSLLDFHDALEEPQTETRDRSESLILDTGLASSAFAGELLDSTQTTPKAPTFAREISAVESPVEASRDATIREDQSKANERPSKPDHEEESHSLGKDVAAAAAVAGLVSTIGYFASTSSRSPVKSNWKDDRPSSKREVPLPSDEARSMEHGEPEVELPFIRRPSSPVDPMTMDRSSYLLRSSSMSRKNDNERDTLHSIQEREDAHVSASESAYDVEQERQRALEILSTPREKAEDPFRPETSQDKATASYLAQPANEFVIKSKKDKKKDKKKGKGLSRFSTQDDLPLAEGNRDVIPEPEVEVSVIVPVERELAEESVTSKSKKDRKKAKGLSRSSTQDDLTSIDASQDVLPETETPVPEPVEDFFTMKKSKKDKKKSKSLSRSSTQDDLTLVQSNEGVFSKANISEPVEREPVAELSTIGAKEDKKGKGLSRSLTEENLDSVRARDDMLADSETSAHAPVEAEPAEDFFTMGSMKGKKDKKKNKSTPAWEPEETASFAPALVHETVKDIPEEIPVPSDIQEAEVQQVIAAPETISSTPNEPEPAKEVRIQEADDFSMARSKKDKKRNKKGKSVTAWEPESFEDAPEELIPGASSATQVEIPPSHDRQESSEPVVEAPQIEPTPVQEKSIDEYSSPKSRKDKKKDNKKKSALIWEPEARESVPSESLPEAGTPALDEETPLTRDFHEAYFDQPIIEEHRPADEASAKPSEDFSPRSKNDKKDEKKRRSLLSWGAESSEPVPKSIDEPIQELAQDIPESSADADTQRRDINEPTLEEAEDAPIEDSSAPKSKKDKKKDKRKKPILAWEPESFEDAQEQIQEPMPEIPVPQNLFERQETISHDTPPLAGDVPKSHDHEPFPEGAQTPVDLPLSRDIEDTSELLLPIAAPEPISDTPLPVPEEADSWSAPKSKKDKKKDKKKNKSVLTWPEDDQEIKLAEEPVAERSKEVVAPEVALVDEDKPSTESHRDVIEAVPIPESIVTDDKLPQTQTETSDVREENYSTLAPIEKYSSEPSQFVTDIDSAPISQVLNEPNFPVPKFKKDKKKDKKKGKSTLSWEAEEEQSGSQTTPASLEASRDVSEQPSAVEDGEQFDDLSTPKSKKDKKKDKKKKGKSTSSWDEPEALESVQPEPIVEETRDVIEEMSTPVPFEDTRDVVEETKAPMPVTEAEDEFPTFKSKKDKKKDKKKGKSISPWEPEEEAEPRKSSASDGPLQTAEPFAEEVRTSAAEPKDEFPVFAAKRGKKGKKNGKSFSTRDAEPDQQMNEPITSEVPVQESRDMTEETSTPVAQAKDEYNTFVSKDIKEDQKKDEAISAWEPESEQQIQEPVVLEAPSQPVEDLVQEPVMPALEAEDEFLAFTSKKDKKKEKKAKSSTPSEADKEPPVSEPIEQPLESARDAPESSSTLVDDSADTYSMPKSKKDKKKDKKKSRSMSAWDPDVAELEPEPPQEILPKSSPNLVEEPSSISFGAIIPQDDISSKNLETGLPAKSTYTKPEPELNIPERSRDIVQESIQGPSDSFIPVANASEKRQESSLLSDLKQNFSAPDHGPTELPQVQESSEDILDKAVVHDSTLPEEQDISTRDIPREVVSTQEPISFPESSAHEIQPDVQTVAPETSAPNEFTVPETKKSKKKKKSKYAAWETEGEAVQPEELSLATQADIKDVPQDEPAREEFVTKSIKDEEMDDKLISTWQNEQDNPIVEEPESYIRQPETAAHLSQETPATEDYFVFNESNKPKEGKLTSASEPDQETPLVEEPESSVQEREIAADQSQEAPAPDYFVFTENKKGKRKKGKSVNAGEPEPEIAPAARAVFDEKPIDSFEEFTTDEPHLQETESGSKPAPDGFAAGYDNDQLSLARQLQEEFGSGSKKSKKDKSKRKSLPATPARQPSRSRTVDELTEDHHRARSLSIEPSAARPGVSPGTGERQSVYSAEQLELARQLKEEFGSGSKKSKKDKKKKRDLSQTPAQDDDFTKGIVEEPQVITPEVPADVLQHEATDAQRGDGFVAGYQEDQLSLARQLQAEFGSGSKKSKKDKKRRSTSQTPREQEPAADDYFGESSQPQYSEPLPLEGPEDAEQRGIQDREPVRDGLAVGYSEDQLELARQLKEEFGSGSKKKPKKDKRKSLLRSTTEDDFSSDAFMGGSEQQSGVSTPLDEGVRDASIEPEDAFAALPNKSKRDKKGKKRETSLLRGTADEEFTSEPVPEIITESKDKEPSDFVATERDRNELSVAEAEDEFASVTKSKKDKKGKKRQSLVPVEEIVQPEMMTQDILHQGDTPELEITEKDIEQSLPIKPEEDFAPVSTKGKKDKKDKKGKKRDSLKPDTVEEVAVPVILAESVSKAEAFIPPADSEQATDLEAPSQEMSTLPADEDFTYTTKKSKKDKKNRKSIASTEDSLTQPEPEALSASQYLVANEPSTADATAVGSSTDAVTESDEFSLGRKLSKKEKKRKSLLRSSTFDETSEQPTETRDVRPESESRGIANAGASAPLEEPQDGGFEVSSKKSKKDQKRQKSLQQSSLAEDIPMEQHTTSARQTEDADNQFLKASIEASSTEEPAPRPIDVESIEARDFGVSQPTEEAAPEDMFGDFAFTKKSKKEKKKRKDAAQQDSSEASGTLTPMDPGTDLKTVIEPSLPLLETSEIVEPQHEPIMEILPLSTTREVVEAPVDDWSLLSKKSKKDKKRKGSSKANSEGPSGTSTPLGPIMEPIESVKSELPQDVQKPVPSENFVDEKLEDLSAASKDVQEPEDEWGDAPAKKLKKDKKKRKSGLSTPLEEAVPEPELRPAEVADQPTFPAEPVHEEDLSAGEPLSRDLERSVPLTHDTTITIPSEVIPQQTEETKDIAPEPEDEWSLPSKKSKKEKKKRKSGLSTPIDEVMPEFEQRPEEVLGQSSIPKTITQEEALPIETSLSRDLESIESSTHDAAVAVPTEVFPQQRDDVEAPLARELDISAPAETKDIAPQPEGEWNLPSKKSKKDKKKRKSGLSTPSEEPMPTTMNEEVLAGPSNSSIPPEITPEVLEADTDRTVHEGIVTAPEPSTVEPEGEWGSLTRKVSKKDKKKRKSGVSTPVEELITPEPVKPAVEEYKESLPEVIPTARKVVAIETSEPATQKPIPARDDSFAEAQEKEYSSHTTRNMDEEEATDEFATIAKGSKKGRKGKATSRDFSESGPSSFVPSTRSTSGPINLFPKHEPRADAPEIPERQTSSPVSFEESDATREAAISDSLPDANLNTHHDEAADILPSDLFRKPSKKDKRKRQATVIVGVDDGQSAAKAPLTSWADEVEEAEIIRDHPIIEDLAKDKALSHIPSTTESTAVDDFRPAKKGKKGKKRDSIQSEPVEIPRPPIGADLTKHESSDKSSNIPAFAAAAAGAALAGATLFGKAKESPEETSTSEASTPVRKLSKKEKRKQSIDKRTAKEDDIFDDPSLWEGEKPRAYEESRHQGEKDDGSWSPPHEEEQVQNRPDIVLKDVSPVDEVTARESKVDVASHLGPQQWFPSFAPDAFSKLEEMRPMEEEVESGPEIEPTAISTADESKNISGQESQSKDSFYEFVTPRSGEAKEDLTSSLETRTLQGAPHQDKIAESIEQPYLYEPSRSIVTTPPEERNISFEGVPPISQEHISTPHRDFTEPHDTDRSFYDSPVEYRQSTPLSSRKYARVSDLPVVHEEVLEPEEHPSRHDHDAPTRHRDSAYESPIPPQKGFSDLHEHVRDSGVHLRDFSPAEKTRAPVSSTDDAIARLSWPPVDEETETVDLHRSQRLKVSAKKHYEDGKRSIEVHDSPRPKGDKTTDFYHSQRVLEEKPILHHDDSRDTLPSQRVAEEVHTELHRTPTIHGTRRPSGGSLVQQRLQKFESPDAVRATPPRAGNIVKQRVQGLETPDSQRIQKLGPETPDLPPPQKQAFATPGSQRSDRSQPSDHDSPEYQRSQRPKEDKYAGLTSAERPKAEKPKGFSDLETGVALAGAATLGFAAARKLSQEQRPNSAQSIRSSSGVNRLRTPDLHRPDSVNSNRSGTPPLRRSDRKVADLRSLSQRSKPDLAKEAEIAAITASAVNTANPTANEGRVRTKDMADVYDGFGEGRMGSPRSPTRPHSMRRRQSMQVLELENRVEQLAADNRMLAEFKAQAERNLHTSQTSASVEKDAEIDSLKRTLDWLQHEVTRLTEMNEGLTSANTEIARQHADRYGILETQHAQATRALQETKDAHTNLSSGMEAMVRVEVQKAVQDKDQEIAQLRAELDAAKEQIREMQRQILASKANDIDFLTVRDEDYFDNACQQLCQHVQQWVVRFSKFSDMRACRLTSEINNDKTIDRLDNAILDGSDVDKYLADRVRRRDVFMSMTMTMVWEFVFTRYLFGMDREQRQKLKSLEKILSEVGPASAVHSWRATTLTLLSKREAFQQQREQDTQAVVHAILETLSEILPPPSDLEAKIEEQLARVMKAAVDLSIEMRCQRAEYMMLPPLQPEYDANGDLASKVSFNAALMNERSGDTVSNEDLEASKAIVRIVLFPLVVKKGDDSGEGDEEIVVCPAQVLVAKGKKARFTDTAQSNHSRMSMQSTMPADAGDGNVI
ncbi:hypothetical protein EG329_001708 [Mollisiaceae sp. DMI_Dod_QoI]|nr:hypothetical protein EG329_001708 [Helotiales sp. DMI_Dod_QoI]